MTTTEKLAQQAVTRIETVRDEVMKLRASHKPSVALLTAAELIKVADYSRALHELVVARRDLAVRGRHAEVAKVARLEGYVSALGAVAAFEYDGPRMTVAGV